MTAAPAVHRLGLEVLDHQLLDSDDVLCGKVDDLELREIHGGLRVEALLAGPGAWAGRLPVPFSALASRFLSRTVTRIEWREVAGVESGVRLRLSVAELASRRAVLGSWPLEARLSTLLRSRVLGAGGSARGHVHDLEASQRGSELVVSDLLVGPAALLIRLGVHPPDGHHEKVPWQHVESWRDGLIRLGR